MWCGVACALAVLGTGGIGVWCGVVWCGVVWRGMCSNCAKYRWQDSSTNYVDINIARYCNH